MHATSLKTINSPPPEQTAAMLRDIIVKEIKALRVKLGKELAPVPKGLMVRCNQILWEN